MTIQTESAASSIPSIPLSQLRPSQTESQLQRRKHFDKAELDELAESVATYGILQPIIVRRVPGEQAAGVTVPDYFEIVAGERRVLAAKIAGRVRIPANVLELNDEQVLEVQLIENLQRADLHPMHEAESYDELVHKYKHPIEEIFAKVGKSRTYVYNRMKLLALSTKARKAFYEGTLIASVAERLSRVPTHKLQDEALPTLLGNRPGYLKTEPLSYRKAVEFLNANFMLALASAPFDVKDEQLVGGPCGKCPKRTGNQPELFADEVGPDVCTDTACFQAKARAWGQRSVETARKEGRPVITGGAATKVAPNGLDRDEPYITSGYAPLNGKVWNGSQHVPVKKLLKDTTEISVLHDGKSGRTADVVKISQLNMPKEKRSSGGDNGDGARRRAAALENKFRAALYEALRPKLKRPSDHELARAAYNALDAELQKLVWTTRGVELIKSRHGIFARDKHEAMIDTLSGDDLVSFMNDCIYAPTLRKSTWSSDPTPKRLLEAAKRHGVDASKIRRELAPKKPAKSSKPAKAKKPASTKSRSKK